MEKQFGSEMEGNATFDKVDQRNFVFKFIHSNFG